MTAFQGFSRAGRLYAENLAVVREMEKAYLADVRQFVETIEPILKAKAPEFRSLAPKGSRYRYWWIGPRAYSESPYLYFATPEDIDHEGLVLTCGVEADLAPLHTVLRGICERVDLELIPGEGNNRYQLFTFGLELDGERFLEAAVDAIVGVLAAMGDAEASLRRTESRSERRDKPRR